MALSLPLPPPHKMALSLPLPPSLPPHSPGHSSPTRQPRFLPRSAASAAAFPEPMPVPTKLRRTVAGVDQDSLVDPEDLADPDSFFFDFRGVRMHHKVAHHGTAEDNTEAARSQFAIILLHGFGASLFSWHQIMRPLARLTGTRVLAFDRPAFGLTTRPSEVNAAALNPYSTTFSTLATLSFIEMLGAEKAILVGHSAGCSVAVNAYFEAPERVAVLILVAPAIFAPLLPQKVDKEKGDGRGRRVDRGGEENPIVRLWRWVCELFGCIARAAFRMLTGMREMVGLIYVRTVSAVLRSAFAVILVRFVMDKFGIAGVRYAWYDASKIPHHVLQGYTKPLRVKGWEKALLEYTIAMLNDSESKSKPPLTRRLSAILCPDDDSSAAPSPSVGMETYGTKVFRKYQRAQDWRSRSWWLLIVVMMMFMEMLDPFDINSRISGMKVFRRSWNLQAWSSISSWMLTYMKMMFVTKF